MMHHATFRLPLKWCKTSRVQCVLGELFELMNKKAEEEMGVVAD